ncbi:MAG: hypothetical protein QGG40_00105 [Myxococcota bacterium]|nr:hypothetical protein [Myxococcota bacterium]
MFSHRSALFAGLLALTMGPLGCGKKAPPEPPVEVAPPPPPPPPAPEAAPETSGPRISLDLGKASVTRKAKEGPDEQVKVKGNLRVSNQMNGPINIQRVEFTVWIGEKEMGHAETSPNLEIPPGDTRPVGLNVQFKWRDGAPLPGKKARFAGEIHWSSAPGKNHTRRFDVGGDIDVSQPPPPNDPPPPKPPKPPPPR